MGDSGSSREGRLIICPTPIGNLGDITQRTLQALQECDVVCAEDTRVTGKLLSAYGIEKRLERLDEAMISQRADQFVRRVQAGECIAYCSDAGMPGVSDPGLRLVRIAREAGVPVEVLPGASASSTAYVASGCTSPRFLFAGFFPRKVNEQQALLESVANLDAALVIYESPNRLVQTLQVIATAFPYRELTVCRELTKLHEEVVCGTTGDVASQFAERMQTGRIHGEIVIVVDGPSAEEALQKRFAAEQTAEQRAESLRAQGLRKKEIARILVEEFDLPRNSAYEIALRE